MEEDGRSTMSGSDGGEGQQHEKNKKKSREMNRDPQLGRGGG